jgi:gluconolactonase
MVYNPEGEKMLHIPVPAKWTANVCFGGKKNKLFIIASELLFVLDMKVNRVPIM